MWLVWGASREWRSSFFLYPIVPVCPQNAWFWWMHLAFSWLFPQKWPFLWKLPSFPLIFSEKLQLAGCIRINEKTRLEILCSWLAYFASCGAILFAMPKNWRKSCRHVPKSCHISYFRYMTPIYQLSLRRHTFQCGLRVASVRTACRFREDCVNILRVHNSTATHFLE